jgi:hypothetical protein
VTALSSTVVSNLAYVVGAVVLAIILGVAVWWRHRQPKSVDANVASFRRGLMALAPDNRPVGSARIISSTRARGANGAAEAEPLQFTQIKVERVPAPEEDDSTADDESPAAGEGAAETAETGANGTAADGSDVDEVVVSATGEHAAGEASAGGERDAGESATGAGDAGSTAIGERDAGESATGAGDVGLTAAQEIADNGAGAGADGAGADAAGADSAGADAAGADGAGADELAPGQDQPAQVREEQGVEEGVGESVVSGHDVLEGDDNSPAAAEASGQLAGGESG